jgi:hypothetical protein
MPVSLTVRQTAFANSFQGGEISMKCRIALAWALWSLLLGTAAAQTGRNVILFIPDGLRPGIVTPETAPTFARVRDQGRQLRQ